MQTVLSSWLPRRTVLLSSLRVADPKHDRQSEILRVLKQYWGYDSLRPLQAEAIEAALDRRDSLVVLPTGGGKSICYQVPPLLQQKTDIVVSPLISLMKDQVDGLVANGYPASALHSGLRSAERRRSMEFIQSGRCRLVLVSPERLVRPDFLELLRVLKVETFAIDEAHCISHWGHDFRPEYRQLAVIKQKFPGASIHGYTATATGRVRKDIVDQLDLQNPLVLVGSFDRPNLVYRVHPRQDIQSQILEVIGRHRNRAVIVYCISRDETERISGFLRDRQIGAISYHAGMSSSERRSAQEAFSNEEVDVVVATVAFGMGIDRGDVRAVIHVGIPKSIEHYQQETGRAGRDGLEAECILFYSPADVLRWKSVITRSSERSHVSSTAIRASIQLLEQMRAYCSHGKCRHRSLVEYFGQSYQLENCQACDVCLGESGDLEDGTVEAQKILSCVARLQQRYGVGYVVDVLKGAETERIQNLRHNQLSTFGLLSDLPRRTIMNKVYQLIDQELLLRTGDRYPVLNLTATSQEVLRGERKVWLMPVKTKEIRKTRREKASWEDVDRDLFEALRRLRGRLAGARGVPPYLIFSDRSLKEMARLKPRDAREFLAVSGVGEKKLADFGETFLECIKDFRG